jgi:hypothetical protein
MRLIAEEKIEMHLDTLAITLPEPLEMELALSR